MADLASGEAAMRRLALILTLSAIAATPAFAVPQPEAEQAYQRGDYATAFKLWLPLAEAGSARAQENIARMYERGEWVAQDPAMAGEWYTRAGRGAAGPAGAAAAAEQCADPGELHAARRAAANAGSSARVLSSVLSSVLSRLLSGGRALSSGARPSSSPSSRRRPALTGGPMVSVRDRTVSSCEIAPSLTGKVTAGVDYRRWEAKRRAPHPVGRTALGKSIHVIPPCVAATSPN